MCQFTVPVHRGQGEYREWKTQQINSVWGNLWNGVEAGFNPEIGAAEWKAARINYLQVASSKRISTTGSGTVF